MCGIIGYVGPRECKSLLLQGLERLEYRGYDSAGIALREGSGLVYVRAVGNLQNLKEAYHRKTLQTHPDTAGTNALKQSFTEISEAYQILQDPKRRLTRWRAVTAPSCRSS